MQSQNTDLFKIINEELHDARYFAMLQDAVAISGDEDLEGGAAREALAYYNYLLNIQIPNCPLNFNLEELKEKIVKIRMNNLVKLNAFIEESFKENLLFTEERLKTITSEIDKQCDENGSAYLPSGYNNVGKGHFAGLKIEKLKNGNYAISCINQGEGMQYHRKISIKGTKTRYSYQSEEYEINLNSDEGREFLERVLVLQFDAKQNKDTIKNTNVYSSDDLYGLLNLYGKEIPVLSLEKRNAKAVTPQRTGTCPITNTHAMARDTLIDQDVDFHSRKRYHFIIKLRSLIDGFNKYQKGEKKYTIEVLEWALNEFSVRLNKQYKNILNDKEFIYCVKLNEQIKAQLDQDKEKILKEKSAHQPYPQPQGKASTYHQDIFDISKIKSPVMPELVIDKKTIIPEIQKDKINPEDIKNLLTFDENAKTFPFQDMYNLFNKLPHCSGLDEDEFWDKVPKEDLKNIFTKLHTIIKNLDPRQKSTIERSRIFALSLMAYDIAAQLAPRYSAFKLDNKYTWGLDDIYSEQNFFTDPIAYYTVKRIAANFEKRAQSKERIFTNSVNYDHDKTGYEKTIDYVMIELLTHHQRSFLREAKEKDDRHGFSIYTAQELFEYLLKNPTLRNKDGRLLDENIERLIAISGTAHAIGRFTEKYQNKDNIWYFAENKFQLETFRKTESLGWRSSDLFKHLPDMESSETRDEYLEKPHSHPFDFKDSDGDNDNVTPRRHPFDFNDSDNDNDNANAIPHRHPFDMKDSDSNDEYNENPFFHGLELDSESIDFKDDHSEKIISRPLDIESSDTDSDYSENTIYHPYENLIKNRTQAKESFSVEIFPYQPQLSGTLRPKSITWRPDKNQQFLFEELNEDFRSIECSPNFQVLKTLDWISSHTDKLKIEEVRTRINQLLFQYGKLDNAFANQFDITILNINRLFSALQKYCMEEELQNNELLIWTTNLSHDLRYHLEVAAKLYKLPIEQFQLPDFKEILLYRIQHESDENVRSRLGGQLIRQFRNMSPLSLDNCCLLLAARIAANLGEEGRVSDEDWESLRDEVIATIKSEKKLAVKKLNELLTISNLTTIKDWKLIDSQLEATGEKLFIDLNSGSLQEKNENKIKKERSLKTIIENKELFDSLKLPVDYLEKMKLFYTADHILKSDDGRFEFTFVVRGDRDIGVQFLIDTTYQSITIENMDSRFRLLKEREINSFFEDINPFESNSETGKQYQYWQSEKDNDLIFVRHGNDDVAYSYSKDYDLILIRVENLNDISLNQLEEVSEKNNNNPILIDCNGELLLYGFSKNAWTLSKLDNTNIQFINAVKDLSFPKKKLIDMSFLEGLESRLETAKKEQDNAMAQFLESIIKNRIEEIMEANKEIYTATINAKSLKNEIRNEISRFHTPIKNKTLNQLTINKYGKWERSGRELLNLVDPQTEFEKTWSKRLAPIFGISNVRCIASRDKDSLHLESIEHLFLGLSFTVDSNQQLLCNEVPGYTLSDQRSIEILHGLPSVIILENTQNKDDKKYFIPAFKLNSGKKNNALNFNDVVDYNSLCNKTQQYYEYKLNNRNELISTAHEGSKLWVEANLYLAILYRSLGDFKLAIKYLNKCKRHENIDANVGEIAMQIYTRPMRSPIGVSFDLKLASYLKEHQLKWSKDKKLEPFKPPHLWSNILESQLDFYNKTYSSYKNDIAIIPRYCRLTEDELALLKTPETTEESKQDKKVIITQQPNTRFEAISKLSNLGFLEQKINWSFYVKFNVSNILNIDESHKVPEKLTSLRLYGDSEESALEYLVKNFRSLFMDAVSSDEKRRNNFNRTLFALIQNDPHPEKVFNTFASILLFSRDYSNLFDKYIAPENTTQLITEVGNIFYANYDLIKNHVSYLFPIMNPYVQITEVSLPSDFVPDVVMFGMSEAFHEQEFKHPLSKISNDYFISKQIPVAQNGFALELSGLPNPSLLEKKLLDHLKEGHEKNKSKMKSEYNLISKKTLTDFKADINELKNKDEIELSKLERLLSEKANVTPLYDSNASIIEQAEAYNLLQARASGQKQEILISDLFTAFLTKNPSLLTDQNPFLKQEDIELLFAELADYALLNSRVDQAKQVLEIVGDKTSFDDIKDYEKQLLGSVLDKHRVYDISSYPEFLVYEYATKRLLREDQVQVLINLITLIEQTELSESDMQHALLQFAAGGGKTSVLIPILAHRFAQKGFLPVIINTNELYEIGLEEVPKNLRASFQQNIEVIERELEHKWTKKELKKLLLDLKQWRKEGKCLLIKSVTWHSINIAMKSAYFNYQSLISGRKIDDAKKELKLARSAQQILDFFKTATVKLEDESHIVSDPLQQSIKTDGKPRNLPNSQLNFLQNCYDYLMDRKGRATGIAKDAGIVSNRKRPITTDELSNLQKKLSHVLAQEEVFKGISQQDIIDYLLQKDKTRPKWLLDLYAGEDKQRQTADLVVLARAFIHTHLPHILSLQFEKDFGTSIHEGDLTVAPKHEGNSVSSHFGDPILVAALTIQLYEQRGLLPEQVDQLIDKIIEENKNERLWNYDVTKPTEAEQWLLDLNVFTSYKELKLAIKNPQALKNKLREDNHFTKHPEATKKYLREYALPQIKVPEKRITSTAAEMQAGFIRSILFSATPGLPEVYPAFLKAIFLEESFEAQVVDTLINEERNKKNPLLIKKYQTPDEFFAQFPPELLSTMTTLIDRGALLTDFKAENIIKAYLNLDKKQVPTQTAAFFSESKKDARQKMQLKSTSESVKEVNDIPGSGLIEELKRQGIKPEEFMLFLFLDLSKTTGTDIKRPYKDIAGLTIGKEQTVTETIQAAMRERQLLEPEGQSITWIMFKSLYREMSAGKETDVFDPRQVFYWMIKNEARQVESKIIARAYQGILQAISEVAWDEVRKNPETISIYKQALEEIQELSPFKIYEIPSSKDSTEVVLQRHVENLLNRFRLNSQKIPKKINTRIGKIIKETNDLVIELENAPIHQLGNEVEQEMQKEQKETQQQQEQQRIKTKNDSLSDFVFAVEKYNNRDDNLNVIFNDKSELKNPRYQTIRLPGCDDIKPMPLRLSREHFAVIKNESLNDSSAIEELKPIKNILIKITPDNQLQFVACTQRGLEYFSDQIRKNTFTNQDSAYAIIGTSGAIFNASNNLPMSKLISLIQDDECQKMLAYANFLNGKISNPVILSQVIKQQGWTKDQYERLANGVANVHVSQKPVSLLKNEVLEACCGWNNKKPSISTKIIETEENRIPEPQQILRPVKTLDNYIESSPIPVIRAEHALGADLLGKKPQPIDVHPEKLKIISPIQQPRVF